MLRHYRTSALTYKIWTQFVNDFQNMAEKYDIMVSLLGVLALLIFDKLRNGKKRVC